jgi:hypothetical protein
MQAKARSARNEVEGRSGFSGFASLLIFLRALFLLSRAGMSEEGESFSNPGGVRGSRRLKVVAVNKVKLSETAYHEGFGGFVVSVLLELSRSPI